MRVLRRGRLRLQHGPCADLMSRRPMAMAISTPEPTVMPMLSESITNRVTWEMLTAAMASGESLPTQ